METKKKKKLIIGSAIIVVALALLILWEMVGREVVLYEKILVPKEDIKVGQELTLDKFVETDFLAPSVIDGAITVDTFDKVDGQLAKQFLPKGSQVIEDFIYKDDFYIGKDESLYSIPDKWLDSFSSSIRRGDYVNFYTADGKTLIGQYRVAFVKALSSKEVENITSQELNEPLDRTDATEPAYQIEIITTLKEYQKLYALAEGKAHFTMGETEQSAFSGEYQKFLVVQVEKGKK